MLQPIECRVDIGNRRLVLIHGRAWLQFARLSKNFETLQFFGRSGPLTCLCSNPCYHSSFRSEDARSSHTTLLQVLPTVPLPATCADAADGEFDVTMH